MNDTNVIMFLKVGILLIIFHGQKKMGLSGLGGHGYCLLICVGWEEVRQYLLHGKAHCRG